MNKKGSLPEMSQTEHISEESTASGKYHILVVDDEPGDAELVRLAIQDGPFPCTVAVAENGQQAVDILLQKDPAFAGKPLPHLILLDFNMPMMNGREVLKAIKQNPELSSIPVVMLTTSDANHDISAAYALGAAGFVTKPLDVDDLFLLIHKLEEFWFGVSSKSIHPKALPV